MEFSKKRNLKKSFSYSAYRSFPRDLILTESVSNIFAKYTPGSSIRRQRYLLRSQNHCLRSNVHGNTHHVEIEDAMSDLGTRFRPASRIRKQFSATWM